MHQISTGVSSHNSVTLTRALQRPNRWVFCKQRTMQRSLRQNEGRWRLWVILAVIACFTVPVYMGSKDSPSKNVEMNEMATKTDGEYDVAGDKVFFKDYKPEKTGKSTVLLLHGARFSSATWEEIGTLEALQDAGIRAFAVDLPGFAKSKNVQVKNRAEFLKGLVDFVGDVKVIVSPSASGGFSLPYIEEYGLEVPGFVPVAPVGVAGFKPPEKVKKELIVFAVVGENDAGGVRDLPTFKGLFDNFEQLIIDDAEHPAYLDNPELFNKKLIDFALKVAE